MVQPFWCLCTARHQRTIGSDNYSANVFDKVRDSYYVEKRGYSNVIPYPGVICATMNTFLLEMESDHVHVIMLPFTMV